MAGSLESLVGNLGDVLKAAPILKSSPGVSVALAKLGGDVAGNAQQVGGVAQHRAFNLAGQQLAQELPTLTVGTPGGNLTKAEIAKLQAQYKATHGSWNLGDIGMDIGGAAESTAKGVNRDVAQPAYRDAVLPGGRIVRSGYRTTVNAANRLDQAIHAPTSLSQWGPALGNTASGIINTPGHIYRYLHDVEARGGPVALAKAAIPMVVGAAVGGLLTGGIGAGEGAAEGAELTGVDLAAEGATAEETGGAAETAAGTASKVGQFAKTATRVVAEPPARIIGGAARVLGAVATSPAALGAEGAEYAAGQWGGLFHDSWVKTASPNYTGPGGIPVSFGRDIASDVGLTRGTTAYTAVSGALDGFFDIGTPDPLAAAGRIYSKARSAEGAKGVLGKFFGGTAIKTPEDVDRIVARYPSRARMVSTMARLNPAQIAHLWPQYAGIADRLGKANTAEDVMNVWRDAARTQELITSSVMPSLSKYTGLKLVLPNTRWANLTTSLPTMLDGELSKFTNREFTAGDPNAVPGIMNVLRMAGERRQVVEDVGNALLGTSDPRAWEKIMENTSKVVLARQVLKALPEAKHAELAQSLLHSIDEYAPRYFGGRGAGFEGHYGYDESGVDVSHVFTDAEDPDHAARSAALFFNQRAKMTFPDWHNFKNDAREIAQMHDWTVGKAVWSKGDAFKSFIDEWVNEKFFKPLALATGGWALRVSTSEAIPTILRLGPRKYTAAVIASSLAKHDLVLSGDREMGMMMSALHGVLAGVDYSALKGLGLKADDIVDAASTALAMHGGHVIPSPGIDARHSLPLREQDDVERTKADIMLAREERVQRNAQLSDRYFGVEHDQSGYYRSWRDHASLISNDPVLGRPVANAFRQALRTGLDAQRASAVAIREGKRVLDALPDQEASTMLRHVAKSDRTVTVSPHTDWATQAVKAIRGTVYGADGTFHKEVLDHIADGTVPDNWRDMMASATKKGIRSTPARVPGRMVMPNNGNGLQRLAALGHRKVLGPIVNKLSRDPLYVLEFAKERKVLANKVALGEMTQAQADMLAETRATMNSIKFVHNPQDRMKIEQNLKMVAPFYFAQNQAIRRAFRLMANNPGAFEQYMKMMLHVQDFSYTANQQNGGFFVVPGSTLMDGGVTNALGHIGAFPTGTIPIALNGSVDSMQVMFPWAGNGDSVPGSPSSFASAFRPSWGPVAALPLKGIQDFFGPRSHALNEATTKLLGPVAAASPWWAQGLPNSILQHSAEGILGFSSKGAGPDNIASSYNSSLIQVMVAMSDEGLIPPNIQEDSPQFQKFIDRANNLTAVLWTMRTLISGVSPVSISLGKANVKLSNEFQAEVTANKGNLAAATDAFIRKYPDATAETVFQSTTPLGSPFPETAKSLAWVEANQDKIAKWGPAARYLMPVQDGNGPYDAAAYNYELTNHLRIRDTPQDFQKQIYISAGDSWYFNQVKPALDAALKAQPGNSYNIYNALDQVIQNYGQHVNPIWWNDWKENQGQTNRLETLDKITQMVKDPAVARTQQGQHLAELVNLYDYFQGLKTAKAASSSELKARWELAMVTAAKDMPDVAPAITSIFNGLG